MSLFFIAGSARAAAAELVFTDADADYTSATSVKVFGGRQFTAADDGGINPLAFDGGGLYALSEASDNSGTQLTLSIESGYSFDLNSLYIMGEDATISVAITFANNSTANFTVSGFNNASFTTISGFSTPIDDVKQVVLTSAGYAVYNNFDISDIKAPTYTVTYNGNSNTAGSVPTDGSSPYANGATVTVLGNSGALTRTGFTFSGWNTAADGSGTDRAAASTFTMGTANVILYAKWTVANSAPVLTLDAGSQSFTENSPAVRISSGATVFDAETNWNGGTLTARISANAEASDTLAIGTATGLTVSGTSLLDGATTFGTLSASGGAVSNNTTLTITFNANGTDTRVQNTIRALTYVNSSDAPSTSTRTVTLVLTDGAAASDTETRSITITATNDAPAATGLPASLSFTEDTQAGFDIAASAFSDPDSANITATLTASAGTFGLAASGSVTLGGNGTGTITVAGTPANVNQYLNEPTNTMYTPALNANGTGAATVTVTLNDGNGSGNVSVGTISLDITAVNDAPSFTGGATLSTVNEDTAAPAGATISSLLNGSFSDVDGNSLAGIAITASAANGGTEGKWQYSTDAGTSWFDVGSVSTAGALLLSAATTLRFLPVANYSGTPGALTVYAVDDSSATTFTSGSTRRTADTTGDDATSKVAASGVALATSITAVNDAPTLTATGLDPTFGEGGSAVDLFGTVTASTVDSSQTFAALTLTVTNVSDGANEILTIGGTDVALTNGNAGTLTGIGNFSVAVAGGTATISASGMTRSEAQMGTLVDGIAYRNTATTPGATARVVTLTGIQDNGGTANGGVDSTTLSLASTITIDLAPTITGRSVPSDGTYKTGQNLDFTVTYSENVTVNTGGGTPYIALTLDTGGSVQAAYSSGSGTATLTFRYTVAGGNADSDGIAVASSITLNGGTIRDGGNTNAPTTGLGFGATTAVLVDGVVPSVSSSNRQAPSSSTTNATSVVYRVTFSEAVTGVDTADFTLTMTGTADGTVASVSAVSGSVYDVTVNAVSGDGVLRLDLKNAGTGIADGATNAIAAGYTSGQTYTLDSTAPSVTSVSVPSNATYVANQNLDFVVNWVENVTVDTAVGTPAIALTIGSTGRSATYLSGSGTSALSFRYTVQSGDADSDGITVGALALDSGTLKDSAGNDATLTLNSVGSTANVKVDAVAPSITGRTVPANGTYKSAQNLDFTVTYSENVTVNTGGGTPYIGVTLDTGGSVQAAYNGGTGTSTLTFRYTLASGNADSDGIAVASSITLNGGTIRDGIGNDAATTSLGFASTAAVLVDAVAPAVASIDRQTPSGSSTSATSVVYRATFTETVTGVDATDFSLTTTGTAVGSVASVAAVSGTVYDVTVDTISGDGTLRLDLKNAGTGIADGATNAIATGFTSGQTFAIDSVAPTLPAANIVVNNQGDPHKLVLTFSEALDNATLGTAGAWTVTANGGTPAYSIASVGLSSGNVVTLTLAAVSIADTATTITNAAAGAHVKVTPPATLKDAAGNAYAAGLVTEAGATHVLDTTAPTLSAVSATATNATAGTLDATASEKARGYWIAVATGAAAPTVAQVKAAANYGAETVIASGNGALSAAASSLALSNLLPVANYALYLAAEDAAGNLSAAVSTATWTALTGAPTATTGSASSVGTASATLNGTVNDNGLATTVSFDYGTTTAYGTNTAATTGASITAGAGNTAAALALSSLGCGTTYHFRIKAVNGIGTANGADATFTTGACATTPDPDTSTSPNPFNPGGTQTETNLDPGTGVEPTRAPPDIVTNIDNLDNRVGISDNGVVVVLDNGLKEPVKFRDNPPDNVLISLPSQKPLDVQLNGNTLNILVDPETPNPPKQTILGTSTLQLPDGTQAKGLQLVQGEVSIGNSEPSGLLGGLELSQDTTLRGVVVQAGPEGGAVGLRKQLDGSGSVSAEMGEVRITVRLKSTGIATLVQGTAASGARIFAVEAVDTAAITLTLKSGEVARFNALGELSGVFLGSLSGTAGKTGDPLPLAAPGTVAAYPASTVVFDGGNVPGRIGMRFRDFMNQQNGGTLQFMQRDDGLLKVTSVTGEFYARAIGGFEVVAGAADGPTANVDGSLSLTYGGIRSTYQPMLADAADAAYYFAGSAGYVTEIREDGTVQLSGGATSGRYFFVARPRHGLRADMAQTPRSLTAADATGCSLFYNNGAGQRQQLDAAFHDEAQVRMAAAAQGWLFTRSGYGGNNLRAIAPDGQAYRVVPDFRVDVLETTAPSSVFRREGERLYFYYGDEPLRQSFTLQPE